jgi:hypothetical protein
MGVVMNNMPAFPLEIIYTQENEKFNGMTLRDYFAAKAMQSMNSRPDYDDVPAVVIAADAYTLADAMMKVREA